MYRLGRPARTKRPKKFYLFEIVAIFVIVAGVLFSFFWFVIRQEKPAALRNNDTPLTSRIEAADSFTEINEPTFSMRLPGNWKEMERNQDPGYKTIKWDYQAKGGIGRWIKIYIDKVPADYPVVYVVPVSSDGEKITSNGASDHCSQFTPGAMKPNETNKPAPNAQEKMPSSWQDVRFLCDGAHPLYQRLGTSSKEAINSVSVTGPTQGTHKYFFVYDDAFYNPDFNLFSSILDSFKAK